MKIKISEKLGNAVRPLIMMLSGLMFNISNAYCQNVVEVVDYSARISGSGTITGGTTKQIKIVIITKDTNIQFCNLLQESHPFYNSLCLDYGDTLEIFYREYSPNEHGFKSIAVNDSLLSGADFINYGTRKTLLFNYLPGGFNFFDKTTHKIILLYSCKNVINELFLPEIKICEELTKP